MSFLMVGNFLGLTPTLGVIFSFKGKPHFGHTEKLAQKISNFFFIFEQFIKSAFIIGFGFG